MGRSDVEELENRIRELEATVTGLTDELLECKQRIDELEDVVDAESDVMEGSLAASSDQSSAESSSTESTSLLEEVDTYTAEGDESESEAETEEESGGIIVA